MKLGNIQDLSETSLHRPELVCKKWLIRHMSAENMPETVNLQTRKRIGVSNHDWRWYSRYRNCLPLLAQLLEFLPRSWTGFSAQTNQLRKALNLVTWTKPLRVAAGSSSKPSYFSNCLSLVYLRDLGRRCSGIEIRKVQSSSFGCLSEWHRVS